MVSPKTGWLQVPAETTPSSASHAELSRFKKIMARLKWKLPFLAESYRLATLRSQSSLHSEELANAEIMFKLDFHEYYALLERAIVHLLGVFDIVVSSRFAASHLALNGDRPLLSSHRYHANVLEALDTPSCPLYSVLGTEEVQEQLRRAKELRNRWKTADSPEDEQSRQSQTDGFQRSRPYRIKGRAPLESYDFNGIFTSVFAALEEGYHLAQQHVSQVEMLDVETISQTTSDPEGAGWDFIVDAMDWEAV
ncbi:hypothetical protein ASPZODRAFT_1135432 [Penicilliopsis zonata CBS 506.65]|uniref:Uncharacterized protein n=1 Tax=Penicilliopsis zonata CBS 506.65 TaxID=1073090 RepID=A0A1L9ST04_9EURO|nr:hypothetical protein ASPZODRAFT_1135432 [Penicilliopsis zonata CBS 506.65]OJJ50231.1 hypothetical protein ASPZODRAFT_1135432 [Penicilliopsis zonata CBS 506.65]